MRLIRSLVFPWFVFYLISLGALCSLGIQYPHIRLPFEAVVGALAVGFVLCLWMNLQSLRGVGLWMSDAVPESLRYFGSIPWLIRAFKALIIAGAFWGVGLLPWMPLVWQAIVLPVVITIALFVCVFNLFGPVMKWTSNSAANRVGFLIYSFPFLVIVPATALFVSQSAVTAFRSTAPDAVAATVSPSEPLPSGGSLTVRGQVLSVTNDQMRVFAEWPVGSGQAKTLEIDLKALSPRLRSHLPKAATANASPLKIDSQALKETPIQSQPNKLDEKSVRAGFVAGKPEKRAESLREIYEFAADCSDYSRQIQAALIPDGSKEVVYWAVKAVECSNLKSVIALPRLVQIMTDHPDAETRAAAIMAMRKYGPEGLRQVSYLLVKRISLDEPPEVVNAAATVLAPLGDDHRRWVSNRLKTLLDDESVGPVAADVLIREFNNSDLVADYVSTHLSGPQGPRSHAINMICRLPQGKRNLAEAHVASILATVKSANADDPSLHALSCMGKVGTEALRAELSNPQRLPKALAAQALAELDTPVDAKLFEISSACVKDENADVRRWCSQLLGRSGVQALPVILDLLESGNQDLVEAGRLALRDLDDDSAKDELEKIVADNSGWMANKKKLQVAKAASTALARLETDTLSSTLPKDTSSSSSSSAVR